MTVKHFLLWVVRFSSIVSFSLEISSSTTMCFGCVTIVEDTTSSLYQDASWVLKGAFVSYFSMQKGYHIFSPIHDGISLPLMLLFDRFHTEKIDERLHRRRE